MSKKERKEKLNIPQKNSLQIAEECQICGGREFVINEEGKAVPCSCRKDKEVIRRLIEFGIPPKFRNKSLDNFSAPDKRRKEILDTAQRTATSFDPSKMEKQGLLLRGSVGSGKTHIAIGFLKVVIEKGYTGLYVNVPEILRRIRRTYSAAAEETESEIIEELTDCDLLVLDDLGAEAATGWVRDRLYLVINALYENNKTLIVTSNCSLAELEEQVGPRITSRLCELCHELPEFPNEDYRRLLMK